MRPISTLLARRNPVVTVLAPHQLVSEAVALMAKRRVGAVLVVRDGRLVGIFTERDVVVRVLAEGRSPASTPVSSVMSPDPVTAEPGDAIRSAVEKMQLTGCRHLPVLFEGQVADTLSMRDLLFEELSERRSEVEALRSYIRGDPAG